MTTNESGNTMRLSTGRDLEAGRWTCADGTARAWFRQQLLTSAWKLRTPGADHTPDLCGIPNIGQHFEQTSSNLLPKHLAKVSVPHRT